MEMPTRDLTDQRQAHMEVTMVVGDEGHGANVDCVDRVGLWVNVEGAKGEALPRREAVGG